MLALASAKSVVGWNAAEWATCRWNNPWLVDLAHCATPKPWDRILWGICVRRPSFMTTCAAHSRARNLFGILSPRARKFAAQCHGPFMKKHFWQTSVLTNCFVAFTKNGIRKDHSTCWTTTSGDLLHFRDKSVTLSTLSCLLNWTLNAFSFERLKPLVARGFKKSERRSTFCNFQCFECDL